MAETYANFNAATTVAAAGYTAGTATLTVGTTGTPFPATGTFSVVITDQNTNASKVLLRVTSIIDGTRFAVTPEGNDASAVSGDNVYAVLSVASIDNVRKDIHQIGVATSFAVTHANNVYFPTDSLYSAIVDDGASLNYFADGKQVYPPSLSTWTWNNQSNSTLDITKGYSVMTVPTNNAAGASYQYLTVSSTGNYTHTFLFRPLPMQQTTTTVNRLTPVYISDGTKLVIFTLYANSATIPLESITITTYSDINGTSGAANPVADNVLGIDVGSWYYAQVVDNGTNLTLSFGADGNNWVSHYSASRTTIFSGGATRIGWGGYLNASTPQVIALVSYH